MKSKNYLIKLPSKMMYYKTTIFVAVFLLMTISIFPFPNDGNVVKGELPTFRLFSNSSIGNYFDNKFIDPNKLKGTIGPETISTSRSYLYYNKGGTDDLPNNFVKKENTTPRTPKTTKASRTETYFTDSKLRRGNALNFDGNHYVGATRYKGISGNTARTIEMWVRSTQNGKKATLIEWGSNTDGGKWQLNRLANGRLQVNIKGARLNTTRFGINVADGKWHHIAVVLNGNTLNHVEFYVDGYKQDKKLNRRSTININTGTYKNLHIGCAVDKTNKYVGEIDEVRLWDVALSDNDIRKNIHLTLAGTETNLVSYWQFNESSGTTFTDVTGNNDLTRGDGANRDTFPAIRPSTAPVAGGTSNLQILNRNSTIVDFAGTDVSIRINHGRTNSVNVIVYKLTGDDATGKGPLKDIPALRKVTPFYWIVRSYNIQHHINFNMIFTLESPAISKADEATPSNLKLLSRRGGNNISNWNILVEAYGAEIATNRVGFRSRSLSLGSPLNSSSIQLKIGTIGSSALPITLSSFQGVAQQGTNLLQWVTSSEINNDRFELLRSSDGLSYDVIGTVKGNGTTTIKQHYQYKDESPLYGKNYYRLRQIDIDGTSTLSETIVLLEQSYATLENKLDYVVYPNPTDKENISLRISSPDTHRSLKISIYDVYGRMHFHKEYTADILHKDLTIDTAKNMESGIYLGIIQQGNQKVQHKIVIR